MDTTDLFVHQDKQVRILSASTDASLNRTRALLLEYHGFTVTACESKEEAHQELERTLYDVLIFGSTLPRDTCWELAGVFRQRNSKGRIIEIIPAPWATPKNQPDATIVSGDEPTNLINLIRRTVAET